MTDRFRIWFLPGKEEVEGKPLCYVMMRKLDLKDLVLVYAQVVLSIGAEVTTAGPGLR
jgi:hypothetical protein